MWKSAVFVCILLGINLELSGAEEDMGSHSSTDKTVSDGEVNTGETGVHGSTLASVTGFTGRLLVVPMDGSHWVGMKAIVQEMGRRGHQVTVVIPEVSMRMGPGKHYSIVTYPVPYDKADIDSLLAMQAEIMSVSRSSLMESISHRISILTRIADMLHTTAESLLFNASLVSHLSQQGFDAVFTDPMVPTGSLIARKLGLPSINLLRGMPCALDTKSAACPSPPSYVPRFFTRLSDQMNFKERVINVLVSLMEPWLCRLLYWRFDQIAYQFLGEDVGIAEVLSDSAIWLMRYDFTFEFPRPLMPNMVLVGGMNCNLRNPLPEDLESWVSGEHGFVVFALGTMVSSLPEDTTAIFLDAFRKIPQKVIWRYTGPAPDNMPENVKMMKWIPQNDLLAHHGARAFITHGGSHSLYEGLCHAVPMVMLPIRADQPDNVARLASRGVGVVLDTGTITVETLLHGLNEVINNTRYKDSVVKLSAIHKDRPIDPLDLSVYWTEFVMRHKGAAHLRPAAHDLNWFQYHSLDVITLLVTVVLVIIMVTVKCLRLCLRRLNGKRKQE